LFNSCVWFAIRKLSIDKFNQTLNVGTDFVNHA
jgi:hypothetical protein